MRGKNHLGELKMDALFRKLAIKIKYILVSSVPKCYRDDARVLFWGGENHSFGNAFQYFYGGIEYRFYIVKDFLFSDIRPDPFELLNIQKELDDPNSSESYMIHHNH